MSTSYPCVFPLVASIPRYSPSHPNTLCLGPNLFWGLLFPCIKSVQLFFIKSGCCKTMPRPTFNRIWTNQTLNFHWGCWKYWLARGWLTKACTNVVFTTFEPETWKDSKLRGCRPRGYCWRILAFFLISFNNNSLSWGLSLQMVSNYIQSLSNFTFI